MSTPPGGGGAFISSGRIYEELRRLNETVIKLAGRIDHLAAQDTRITALEDKDRAGNDRMDKQDARIATLERRMVWLVGVALAGGMVLGQLING